MRYIFLAAALVAAAILVGLRIPEAHASTGPIPLNCNRACLDNVVDQYLGALAARDPKLAAIGRRQIYRERSAH
jgi:hypothetical protein